MTLARRTFTFKQLASFLLSLLLCATLFSGCGQKDKTTIGWKPAAPLSVSLTREEKGLWRLSTTVPLPYKDLGVFSIDHRLDVRDEYTYIVIRDRKSGTEQVFQLGVSKGKVKLHIVGEHNLTLQPEENNKIVIDHEIRSGEMKIEIYPDGQKLASVIFENGTEFVFLSDQRLHIEYGSLANSIKREKLPDLQSLFRSDDSISLKSLDRVAFKRDLGISQLEIDWKPEIKANQEALVVELPKKRKSLITNVEELRSTFKTLAPAVQFTTETPVRLWIFLATELLGICLMIYLGMQKGGFLKVVWLCLGTILLILCALIALISDPGYLEF